MIFQGKSGKQYSTIEPAIGKGGEGEVFKICGMPGCVLKVFKANMRTETRHRKLLAMIASPMPPAAMQQITWPMDVVYSGGQFAGYVMPSVSNTEDLNVMYSDKYSCTLSEKITIAMNLCSAINAVHNAGQVCGDLNPKNICVDPRKALVTLVDTDSYHITDPNTSRLYRCWVGLPEYLPKEIQIKMKNGMTLKSAPLPTFTRASDLFALAVHIFALLMNGCHPFACAVNQRMNIGSLAGSRASVAAPQPIDNICNDFFPFEGSRAGITIPKYAPDFGMLPQEIQRLFLRAFVSGGKNPADRPDAVEWYQALSKMQKHLVSCRVNKKHMYPGHLKACPWCEIEARMRSVTAPRPVQRGIPGNPQYPLQQTATALQGGAGNAAAGTARRPKRGKWVAIVIGTVMLLGLLQSFSDILSRKSDDTSGQYVQASGGSAYKSENVRTSDRDLFQESTAVATSGPVYTELDVPMLPCNEQVIEGLSSNPVTGARADLVAYIGEILYEDQVDEYSFVTPCEGCYRMDLSGVQSGVVFELYLRDELGDVVASDRYCTNGEGITAKDLLPGHTYTVEVKQDSGYGGYCLQIGMQKPAMDITGYTSVKDSIEYTDQRNVYSFTVPQDGRYRFELSGVHSGTDFELLIIDALGETVASDRYCCNGEGVTVKDLHAGETYEIQIRQETGFGDYALDIGYQKQTVDISALSALTDSIEYTDQRNVYTFTVPLDGRYRFEISGLISGADVELCMFNGLEERIAEDTYCLNGEGITVKGLKAGETCTVQVRQEQGLSSYRLLIGMQKETVDVGRGCVVNDSIEYTDQRNVYSYTASGDGALKVSALNMSGGMAVELCVFNDLKEQVAGDSFCTNGESVKLTGLTSGSNYEIQVRQEDGTGPYSLMIE